MPPEFFIFPSGEVLRGVGSAAGPQLWGSDWCWQSSSLKYTFFSSLHICPCFKGAPTPFSGLREFLVCVYSGHLLWVMLFFCHTFYKYFFLSVCEVSVWQLDFKFSEGSDCLHFTLLPFCTCGTCHVLARSRPSSNTWWRNEWLLNLQEFHILLLCASPGSVCSLGIIHSFWELHIDLTLYVPLKRVTWVSRVFFRMELDEAQSEYFWYSYTNAIICSASSWLFLWQ